MLDNLNKAVRCLGELDVLDLKKYSRTSMLLQAVRIEMFPGPSVEIFGIVQYSARHYINRGFETNNEGAPEWKPRRQHLSLTLADLPEIVRVKILMYATSSSKGFTMSLDTFRIHGVDLPVFHDLYANDSVSRDITAVFGQ